MLNRFAKLLLVLTSFAPVLITFAFVEFTDRGMTPTVVSLLGVTAGLVLLCHLLIKAVRDRGELVKVPITSIRSADGEVVGFVLAYLLPLVNVSSTVVEMTTLWFILAVFILVVWGTNAYHVNPLLAAFRYKFYEVTTAGGVGLLLLTKKDVRSAASVGEVVQLTDYMILSED